MGELENVDPGVIGKFLEELPEKAFRLSLRVVLAALALLIGIQLIRLVRHVLKKALKRSKVDESASRFIDSFVKYALYFVLVLTIASSLGVDAASIIAILGSASVAVGLALQGSLSNLAGGILILLLKPFSIGDYIMDSQGNEGIVDVIEVFYTRIHTADNKMIMLPNGALANGHITNFTRCKERRVDIPVSISYRTDIKTAKAVLMQVLEEETSALKEKEKAVFVDYLGESGINMNVRCWVGTEEYWEAKWRLAENVKYALDDAGIEIPYPQMDVHISK